MKKPFRRVTKIEYIGACRYTGYQNKTIEMTLECGHAVYRKLSQGTASKARCRECGLKQSNQ